jgi:DNA polymerase III alpha subunit
LPREDAEEIWRQMASFAGYSFCKGHSAAFAVLSYQVAFMKAHFPAEFFAGVLTNEGGFYGAHAYLQEARRWGIEIQRPCVNASRVEYTGLTLDAEAARRAAGLENAPSETLDICAAGETGRQECLPHRGVAGGVAGMQGNGENDHVPFRLPRGTGRTGWIRVGLMAIQGVRQDIKEQLVREREEHGAFASLDDMMERTDIGLEECRAFAMAGALDALADDEPGAEVWKPRDPRRVLQKRRALLLKAECLFRARDAGVNDGFVKLTFPVWKPNYELRITNYELNGAAEGGAANVIAAIKELSKLEADVLNFTLSADPLDLVQVPPEVVPAREIRSHNNKRIYMAGWMIAAKLLATKTTGQAMKMLTLEDNSGTFEAVLFPRVYAKYAPRTLGRGPYLVCGKVDMTLGSPTLNVEKIEVLPQRNAQA